MSWFGMSTKAPPAAADAPPPRDQKSIRLVEAIDTAIENKSNIKTKIVTEMEADHISDYKAEILLRLLSPYMVLNQYDDDNPDGPDYVEPRPELIDLHSRDINDSRLYSLLDTDKAKFLQLQTSMNNIVNCALTNPDNNPPRLDNETLNAIQDKVRAGVDPDLTTLQAKCWIALLHYNEKYAVNIRVDVYSAVYWCLGAHEAAAANAAAAAAEGANEARADADRDNAGRANAAGANAPDAFICPITRSIMEDPVIISDGRTYERTAIEKWLNKSKTSPLTNEPLRDSNIVLPNWNLKNAIVDWKQNNSQKAGKRKRRRRTIKKRKGVKRRTKRARTASRR